MASPSPRIPARSPGSSAAASGHSPGRGQRPPDVSIPVETLVEYLLEAKRALSSMTLVFDAQALADSARAAHEEAVLLRAETEFLHRGVAAQVAVLHRFRDGLARTHGAGRRDMRAIVRRLDAANARLDGVLDSLRNEMVAAPFRPSGEEPRSLMDFIDETDLEKLRGTIKASLGDLQSAQQSFDTDLARFDTDVRAVVKTITAALTTNAPSTSASPIYSSPAASTAPQTISSHLAALYDHSHAMAELLTSLNKHFDLCVTAVRDTEGGVDLARRRAAESSAASQQGRPASASRHKSAESVSISGVIAAPPHENPPDTPEERAEMLAVVASDAAEVPGVRAELDEHHARARDSHAAVVAALETARSAHASALRGFRALEEVGARLVGYAAAEGEFSERWAAEVGVVAGCLEQLDEMRHFYASYSQGYDYLVLEAERRRAVEDRVAAVWRKASEAVEKILDGDRRERDAFNAEISDFIPTDLWPGIAAPARRWEVVRAGGRGREDKGNKSPSGSDAEAQERGTSSVPILDKELVAKSRQRLEAAERRDHEQDKRRGKQNW